MAYIEKTFTWPNHFHQTNRATRTETVFEKSLRKIAEKKIQLILLIFFVAAQSDLCNLDRAVNFSRLSCVSSLCSCLSHAGVGALVWSVLRDAEMLETQIIPDSTHSLQLSSTYSGHPRPEMSTVCVKTGNSYSWQADAEEWLSSFANIATHT